MRHRLPFLLLLFVVTTAIVLPVAAHAATIPFFGPIIPDAQKACPGSWSLVITVINNIILFMLTITIVFVAPIMIAYAGFLFVVNPVNPGGIQKAKDVLINTISGIVIALAAWAIVTAVMAALYNPDPSKGLPENWRTIITSSGDIPLCIPLASVLRPAAPGDMVGPPAPGDDTEFPPSTGTGACDPETLKGIVPGLTNSQYMTFACIAKHESTCGAAKENDYWDRATPNNGPASTAYGAFQILLSSHASRFEKHVCYDAVTAATGDTFTGKLNCRAGFGDRGFTEGGNPAILQKCLIAAGNLDCNFTVAVDLYRSQGFGAWLADPRSAKQQDCIRNNAP